MQVQCKKHRSMSVGNNNNRKRGGRMCLQEKGDGSQTTQPWKWDLPFPSFLPPSNLSLSPSVV